jgi:DNA-binding NarL/FixJ family response regulator
MEYEADSKCSGVIMNYHQIHSEILLEKLLSMQSSLLKKRALLDVINDEKVSLLDFANAEFIGISLRGRDTFYEFTCKIGDDFSLVKLIKKAKLNTDQLIHIVKDLTPSVKVLDYKHLCDLLKLNDNCKYIHDVMDGKKIIFSLLESNNNTPLATVFIILKAEHYHDENIIKSHEVAKMLWELISPFYDEENGVIYQHCIHEDLKFEQLSSREREIAKALAKGLSQMDIAKEMQLSINTIKTHIKNIYLKCGVKSRVDFIAHLFKR